MTRAIGAAFAGALLMSSACAPRPAGSGAQPVPGAAADSTVVGTVRITGSMPMNVSVTIQDDAGGVLRVDGPLTPEVRALAGARVALRGRVADRGIEVRSYDLRAVDGAPAYVGIVEAAPGGGLRLRLEDGRTLMLGATPNRFRVGQKVWVQGPAAVRVQTFGVIRP